jgi:hypothetical protein
MQMPVLHKIYYALAALHLVMISLYAGHFAEWGKPALPVSKMAATAGRYTGSNNIFSFFAPGLSDQPYVVYTVQDTLKKDHIIDLKGKSPDFSKRINNIYGYLTIKEARPVISASLARFLLDQCPASSKIRIVMVVQQIPQMDEYRDGKRCQWRFWFHRDFQRNNLVASNK